MSETLQLRLQKSEVSSIAGFQTATGIELADGTNFRGKDYNPYKPEELLSLEWSTDKAERVAEYYEKVFGTICTAKRGLELPQLCGGCYGLESLLE